MNILIAKKYKYVYEVLFRFNSVNVTYPIDTAM